MRGSADGGADRFSEKRARDVARRMHVEYDDGLLVVHAQGEGRGVHYFELAFQAFLMMVCVAIYSVLVAGIQYSDNLSSSLLGVMAYTVVLCFSLFKTGALSKSIFNAH